MKLTVSFCVRTLSAAVALAMVAGLAAMAQEDAPPPGMEPIELELPEPSFGGTPLDYYGENLEPSWVRRPPVYAPPAAANVALGKPVTSKEKPYLGRLEFITDGDKSYEDNALVELPTGLQWVQIDLEAPHKIFGVAVWHYHAAERVYFDVVVQLADDADFTENVRTIFNNDHDNSSGFGIGSDKEYVESNKGRLIEAGGESARYVRLYSNGNTSGDTNHYVEVEVYGVPAE